MYLVIIESLKNGVWHTRNHLGDANCSYRSNKMSFIDLMVHADKVRHGWMQIEPGTEFQIGVYDYARKTRVGGESKAPSARANPQEA